MQNSHHTKPMQNCCHTKQMQNCNLKHQCKALTTKQLQYKSVTIETGCLAQNCQHKVTPLHLQYLSKSHTLRSW